MQLNSFSISQMHQRLFDDLAQDFESFANFHWHFRKISDVPAIVFCFKLLVCRSPTGCRRTIFQFEVSKFLAVIQKIEISVP